jgi:trans-aconitate methyltransferase
MDLAAYFKQQFRWRDWARAMGALPDLFGRVVFDLGCGIGDQAELLVARGARVRGFDLNREVVAAARSRGLSNAEFEQADLIGPSRQRPRPAKVVTLSSGREG